MRNLGGFGKIAILVLAVILLATPFLPKATATHSKDLHIAAIDSMTVKYHYLTADEMNALKKSVGVMNPNENYNKIIDGHSTGLAPPSERDWNNMVGKLKVVNDIEAPKANRAKVDFSTEKYFPPIGNQGQQGSCAAWAVNYYAHTYIEAKDNDWDASSGNLSYLMSPAWTYNRINNAQDQGSTFYDNAEVLQTWGSASLSTMPYLDNVYTSWGTQRAMREAPLHRIKDFYYIEDSSGDISNVVTKIKTLLNQGIPVNFGIDADVYDDAFKDGNYIISSQEYDSSLQPNHGQTIIGYDDTVTDDGDRGAFKIANSWGSSWGDKGYYWITYKAFEEVDYNNQGFPMYMVDRPAYQPQLLAVLQFKNAPEMDSDINFTVMNGTGIEWKDMYYNKELPGLHATMPTLIAYDITDLMDAYSNGYTNITMNITKSVNSNAELYEFYIEKYDSSYSPGAPAELSMNAPNLPSSLPCNISLNFTPYQKIEFNTAIDNSDLTLAVPEHSSVNWVAVPYDSYSGGSAMRSGVLGDYGSSIMAATINGPGLLTFYWKISASSTNGALTFYDNGTSKASLSGETSWTKVSALIGGGTRTLTWVYEKNSTGVGGNDTAWVDTVTWEKRNDKVPSEPQNLSAKQGTGFVDLSWKAPVSNGGAAIQDYRIYRGVNETNMSLITTVDANITSYNDTSVTNGLLYYYYVKAENYVGPGKSSNIVNALPAEFPQSPRNLSAQSVFGGVNLTWLPPSNVNAAGLSNYTIYRADNGTGNFVKVGAVNASELQFNDTSAPKGVKVDYYVVAVNWMGESKKSNMVTSLAYGAPDAPTDVKEIDGSGSVTITWKAPQNNGGSSITSYRIYRKAPSKDFTLAGEANGNSTKFVDNKITNGVEYVYVVSAVNKFGEGTKSEQVTAHPADIILNLGGQPYSMSYAELGIYVIIILAVIIAVVYGLKRRKAKKKQEEETKEQEKEGTTEEKSDEEIGENKEEEKLS